MSTKNKTARGAASAVLALWLEAAAGAQLPQPVALDAGLVDKAPESSPGILVFKGVPFAAPPVGPLRWQPPQPVAKWRGVRDASEFGSVCMQPAGPTDGPGARLNIAVLPDSPRRSEDCLYLNVWTGAQSADERRPVMVYFFGGAFTEGAGSVALYDGDALARKGVVVVTMNYRLGAFGFFAHPALAAESPRGASGNYGLMDMLASLRWVQANIAAFGGDPGNVTVFGQSAGAMALAALVASPEAAGLMQRAIAQSGTWLGLGPTAAMRTRAQAEEAGVRAAAEAGATTAAALRALPAADVEAKLRSAGMIVDGWVIPEDPAATFAEGRQNAVDVLVGSNKDEAFFSGTSTAQQFEEQARARWGALANQFLALYPHGSDAEARAAAAQQSNDGTFWVARLFADYQVRRGNNAYLYFFAQNPPAAPDRPKFPAAHAAELPYVFGNLGALRLFPDGSDPELAAASVQDVLLADRMMSYWTNFARSGDPNGAGLPVWQAHEAGVSERALILAAEPSAETQPAKARLELHDRLYAQLRAAR